MKLTMGQKKALVTALCFGIEEINSLAFAGLQEKGLASSGGLTALGTELAEQLVTKRHVKE